MKTTRKPHKISDYFVHNLTYLKSVATDLVILLKAN